MSFYYLANPYQAETPEIMQNRVEICQEICGHLISQGIPVFSPVVHNHAMYSHPTNQRKLKPMNTDEHFNLIMGFDLTMLKQAKAMLLLQMPGWEKSRGVAKEIEFCQQNNIQIIEHTLQSIYHFRP